MISLFQRLGFHYNIPQTLPKIVQVQLFLSHQIFYYHIKSKSLKIPSIVFSKTFIEEKQHGIEPMTLQQICNLSPLFGIR